MPEEVLKKTYDHVMADCIPMHRLGTAREVANVIEFVASDKVSNPLKSL